MIDGPCPPHEIVLDADGRLICHLCNKPVVEVMEPCLACIFTKRDGWIALHVCEDREGQS
jgi:hypothetical protein